MSVATNAAQQSSLLASTNQAAAGTSPSQAVQTAGTAISTLAGNFDTFLKLLMTQLQNQDPTNPLDTTQFTSQLVQFASVEQQITTNRHLNQLIALTQGEQLLQASSVVGKRVALQADHIPLQNGTAELTFTVPAAQPVAISIYTDTGIKVREAVLSASTGFNRWVWDGTSHLGTKVPDGSYRLAVMGANADGTTGPVNFAVLGTATGIVRQNNAVQLQVGTQTVDFTSVQQVLP